MIQYLYCVEDSLSKMVMPPFSSPNDDVAKRDFVIGAIASNTPLQDLHLWRVGKFTSGLNDGEMVYMQLDKDLQICDPTLSEVAEYSEQYYSILPSDKKEVNTNE